MSDTVLTREQFRDLLWDIANNYWDADDSIVRLLASYDALAATVAAGEQVAEGYAELWDLAEELTRAWRTTPITWQVKVDAEKFRALKGWLRAHQDTRRLFAESVAPSPAPAPDGGGEEANR